MDHHSSQPRMASIYEPSGNWQVLPPFSVPESFENSLSPVNWEKSMEDPWLYEIRPMEDSHYQRESFDEGKSKDLFPLSIPCGNNPYAESKSFRPDNYSQSPGDGEPLVCSPADLSPQRSPSTPPLSPDSPLASAPPIEMRARTPEYFESETFSSIGPEITRADVKKNPHAFVNSVFPRAEQAALRDRLRDVIRSQWWTEGTPEPRGFLGTFVKRVGPKVFECHSCRKRLTRADRAVDHFRVHILHRPFHCPAGRGCGDYNCKMTFMTRDCLKSHTAKHEKTCPRCHTTVEDKNLLRHQATRKCRRSGL